MSSIKKWALVAALAGAASVANAQFSSTITATNDYDFRGFSQSAKDPALQASADYAFGESGWAIGAWASNVDFDNDADVELDLYGGYTGTINDNASWNAGLVYYAYPGSDDVDDYWEAYVGLALGPVGLKQWYSDDLYNLGDSAFYTEANASFPIGGETFSILAHLGYSYGDAFDTAGDDVLDYSIGVGASFYNFDFALKWVDTDTDLEVTDDVLNNEGRVIFTVATTLPWGE